MRTKRCCKLAIRARVPTPQAITQWITAASLSVARWTRGLAHDVRLDFIRPGKPVENAFIELNGRLRDESLCLEQLGDTWEQASFERVVSEN